MYLNSMNRPQIQTSQPVTLIGGGDLSPGDLALALSHAPVLVAADGGAGAALRAGHVPDAVYGDFDSLSQTDRAAIPPERLHPIAEQDSTDFDKALRHVAAPLILAVGFLGARVDHQLAVLHSLAGPAASRCILIGAHEVIIALPPRIALPFAPGDVVSLFPMRPVQGRSTGLEWPIDGLQFAPGHQIGTSNRALGPVQLDTDGPGLLLIAPRRALDDIIQRLPATPCHPESSYLRG